MSFTQNMHIPGWKRYRFVMLSSLSAIALIVATSFGFPALAQSGSAVSQLPSQDQAALQSGRVTLSGSNGQYTVRVLVSAPAATAWSVLTDYNNFSRFFPSVAESRLLRSDGNQRVFEQINVIRIFPISRRSRIVIAATESYPQRIAFNLVEGDVDSLQGTWQLEPISATQVLITHQVSVQPESSTPRGIFFNIYQNTLQDTLAALKQEAERRNQ
ncbi:MAG: SRPBCC family protein [Elainellaceae cyanobacterium]